MTANTSDLPEVAGGLSLGPVTTTGPVGPVLSDEQQAVLDTVAAGHNVIVDATCGSGKTATIQRLCAVRSAAGANILYLTYSRLLKADAQSRVGGAKVQNYHGLVYPYLLEAGIEAGLGESVAVFNENFEVIAPGVPGYDMIVIDEYQDINTDYAQLLRNLVSRNPAMQIVMVGDLEQKVSANTTLDAGAFARELAGAEAVMCSFTRSFRIGPAMAHVLGKAWNKPIVGVNKEQRVLYLDHEEAIELICGTEPGELLCLGKRNGAMMHALNEAERKAPERYNKQTVFASIRDGDADSRPHEGAAVFTTYDSSKGMERPVCVVFDYGEATWDMRNNFPGCDSEVLRNVFLVAASRGKGLVVFVRSGKMRGTPVPDPGTGVGFIPVNRFLDLPHHTAPVYERPFAPSSSFDFVYGENLAACMALISRERLDDGTETLIEIERTDGLIDLSPAIGIYQEALFFESFDASEKLAMMASVDASFHAAALCEDLSGDPWRDALVLAAVDTSQLRYHDQVTATVDDDDAALLTRRLGEHLSPDAPTQVRLSLSGTATGIDGHGAASPISFAGFADAICGHELFELKFTSALQHSMFVQTAMYLVMARRHGLEMERAVLFNTRNGERWAIDVPDEQAFLDAAVTCVTKQNYRRFVEG